MDKLILNLASEHIRHLAPYTPGEQPNDASWIKLNTNELPYPPSPKVVEAITAELSGSAERLRLYPDPASSALRKCIAREHDLAPENVIIGNGSDDILNLLVRTFTGQGKAAGMFFPSYSLYPILTDIRNSVLIEIPFDENMKLSSKAIAESGANLFFLTSPNAPTGVGFGNESIRVCCENYEGLLVVDEAYSAFAQETAADLLKDYPRLVVTRTFSKSHGLAGLRVGYALASASVVNLLDRVRDSYNVDRIAQVAALAAFQDKTYYKEVRDKVVATREAFIAKCKERGWKVYPSQANFVFASPGDAKAAQSLFEKLKANKVLVRYFGKHALTNSYLRVSMGTDQEMQTFWKTVDQ